jgi:acylphosphatase
VVAKRVVIRGRVQGVGFRYWLARAAEARGVAGGAANLADGTLEAVFEGDREAVDALIHLSREGPRGARVDSVEVHDEEPAARHGFTIN